MGKGAGMQDAADRQTSANRPNQTSPFGTSNWTQQQVPTGKYHWSGGQMVPDTTTQWSGSTALNPQLSGGLMNLENQFQQSTGSPLDNGAGARDHAENALYSRETSRLDPQWQQAGDSMKTDLLNQGFTPGTEAYDKAYGNFSRAKNDAYAGARNDSITMGGQEATRQQQMDLLSRMYPMMNMTALQGLLQQPQPGQAGDYVGAQQAANQFAGDMWGGLFNLGGKVGAAAVGAPGK